MYYHGGKMSKKQYDELNGRYKYFIPLRGHDDKTAQDVYDYGSDSEEWFANPMQAARGRTSRAAFPFTYIDQMNASAARAMIQNLHRQSIARIAARDQTGLMTLGSQWYTRGPDDSAGNPTWEARWAPYSSDPEVYAASIEAFEQEMEEKEQRGEAARRRGKLDLGGLFIKREQAEHHVVPAMINGEEVVVYINGDPKVADAIMNENIPDASKALDFVKKWSRFMAANFTTRNPAFVIKNGMRDFLYASMMGVVKEGGGYALRMQGNIPRAMRELAGYLGGKGGPVAAEFIANGGRTGYTKLLEIMTAEKNTRRGLREVSRADGSVARRSATAPVAAGRAVLDFLDASNMFVENVMRLAVYMTSKESGRSIVRSISDAKEISLNFNRHGTGKGLLGLYKYVNASYLFSNVAIQALDNITGAARAHPLRFAVMSSIGAFFGYFTPMLVQLVGGDEKYDEYMSLSEWDRKNNLCFPLLEGWLKIPVSQDLRVFHGIGVGIQACLSGRGDWERELYSTLSGLLDLLPYNVSNAIQAGSWAEPWPDVARPVFQLIANKAFTGRTIYDEYVDKYKPGYKQARVNRAGETYSPGWMIGLLGAIDWMTGGDGVTRGGLSLNPDVVNHVLTGYAGGLYDMFSSAMEGMFASTSPGEEFSWFRDTPLRAFFTFSDDLPVVPASSTAGYYQALKRVKRAASEWKGYNKALEDDLVSGKQREEYEEGKQARQGLVDLKPDFDEIARDEAALKNMAPGERREQEQTIAGKKKEVMEKVRALEKAGK
jgi:hypothetical protein